MQIKNQRNTHMVIVSLEGGFMEFIPKEKTETMLSVIDFKKTTGIYFDTNIFEVYDVIKWTHNSS